MDASSLINLKRYIKPERQWDFFNETMTAMVESGDLLIVPQVEAECGKARHPDVPGTWALAKARLSPADRDPSLQTVRVILSMWPELIDPEGEAEQADPYVVARALELQDSFAGCLRSDRRHDQSTTGKGVPRPSLRPLPNPLDQLGSFPGT